MAERNVALGLPVATAAVDDGESKLVAAAALFRRSAVPADCCCCWCCWCREDDDKGDVAARGATPGAGANRRSGDDKSILALIFIRW